jgi:hypothetical protein
VPPFDPSVDPTATPPLNGDVWQFQVTTDGDILSIGNVLIAIPAGATLYNHPFGDSANANPGNPALIAVFPSLDVDSWITTPGVTTRLGADLPGDGITTFGDLTNDGPQSNFIFAQLTVPHGVRFSFFGVVSIASSTTGSEFTRPFAFVPALEPEPTTFCMAGLSFIGFIATSRRRKA